MKNPLCLNDSFHISLPSGFFMWGRGSVAKSDATSTGDQGGCEFEAPVRQHSFVEIDHEIFSTVIVSLPLIQEGKLSVTCERMCTEYWLTA